MKTHWILTPLTGDTLRWQDGAGTSGVGTLDEFAALPATRQSELVLAVPAQKVLLREVSFAPSERRLLRQTVPFTLEEQLLDDVETQHFALGPIEGQQVPVAVVQQQWFADWIARCTQAGLEVKHAVPEMLLLPWQSDSWSLYPQAERWLVRVDRWRGFALETENAQLALQLLLDNAEQLPQRLIVFISQNKSADQNEFDAENTREYWQTQLPEMLRGIVEIETLPLPSAPLASPTLDLLQGRFARRLPWQRWAELWRVPAIAAAIAIAVQFMVAGFQHHQLQKENIALRQQVEQIYRSVEPAGAVVEPERQLQRKVKALQGSQGSAVLPLLQRLGGAIKSINGITIQTLGYSEKQNELRLNIIAGSFKDVESLRAAIVAAGLDAQLVSSSADGDATNPKTRAQLRIAERR